MPYIGNIVQDFSVNNAMLNTDSVTSIKIDDGTIVNADINDSAAIAVSKLANFVTNNAANRVITGSGTTNTLNGNSDLLWNGSRLDIDTGGTEDALRIGNTAGTDTFIRLGSIGTTADTHAVIKYDKDDNYLSLLVSGESHGNGGMLIANGGAVSLSAGTSPLAKLHVKDDVYVKGSSGDGSTGIQIRSGSSAISGQHQVRTGGGLGNMLIINAAGSTGLLQVQTNGTEKLRIDSSGQVGIGTSSPEEDLHISNDTPVIRLTDSSTNRHAQFVCIDGSLRLDADNNNAQSNTNIAFRTDGTERMRIDSSGRLLIGTTSGTGHSLTGTNNPLLQVESASSNDYARASFIFNGATSVGPGLWFGKSRGTSVGSNTIVNDGDQCGGFFFHAADGTDKYSRVASIQVSVDGTPGSNDTPGRISFSTTSDGSDGTTERMRINSDGIITQPYKPSFFATINGGDNTTNSGGVVPFDQTKHNTGSHFDTSTNKFIAPVAGVYFFCTQIWAKNGTNNARFRFAVDDASNSYSTDNISQNGFHGNSVNREDFGYNASIVWYLDEGDRFYVKVDNTNLTYYTAGASDPHSYFCGHFIG